MNQTWQIRRAAAQISTSLLIRGGRVIDPANDFDGAADGNYRAAKAYLAELAAKLNGGDAQ